MFVPDAISMIYGKQKKSVSMIEQAVLVYNYVYV